MVSRVGDILAQHLELIGLLEVGKVVLIDSIVLPLVSETEESQAVYSTTEDQGDSTHFLGNDNHRTTTSQVASIEGQTHHILDLLAYHLDAIIEDKESCLFS